MADPVMMSHGADLMAVVAGGLGTHCAEKGQGQDGGNQLFHRVSKNTGCFVRISRGRKTCNPLPPDRGSGTKGGDNGYQHD